MQRKFVHFSGGLKWFDRKGNMEYDEHPGGYIREFVFRDRPLRRGGYCSEGYRVWRTLRTGAIYEDTGNTFFSRY